MCGCCAAARRWTRRAQTAPRRSGSRRSAATSASRVSCWRTARASTPRDRCAAHLSRPAPAPPPRPAHPPCRVLQDGATPLFKAAHKGHAGVVGELLKHGPELGLLANGQTALHGAAMFGQLACVRLLARAGAALSARNAAGLTPLQAARQAARRDVADYLQRLAAS